MSYNKFNLAFIFDVIKNNKINYMLELGNQCINNKDIEHIEEKQGKEYFTNNGINHISINWNGNNGALKIDLTLPLDDKFCNFFDLVTNCGTTEHIELQYEVFKNLHNCAKVGCFFTNSVPLDTEQNIEVNGTPTNPHGLYEYHTKFFEGLCKLCDYKIININTDRATWAPNNQGYCNAIYKKINNNSFISKTEFEQLNKYLKYYPNESNE